MPIRELPRTKRTAAPLLSQQAHMQNTVADGALEVSASILLHFNDRLCEVRP
ncbi:MAG: hypothetical protein WC556_01745 [Candidatus Methanoperedens sp.]